MRNFLVWLGPLLLLLAWPTSAAPPQALGARLDPQKMGAGGLLLGTSDGLREAPTLSTDVRIQITGLIARTHVTQRFSNPTPDWVEGIYVFPLPEHSAVDSLEMRVGERVIEGRVEERARAKATYRKAKREGRKASLVEQERPNLFTTSIANLGPDEEVEVTLSYQEELRYEEGRFSLRFPMVVAPRFIPGTRPIEGFSGSGWAHNTTDVPDAARITPPVAEPANHRSHPVTIQVEIDAGFPLEDVESSSHPVRVRAEAGNTYRVRLASDAVEANSDFLLRWRPVVGATPGAALFREQWQGKHYALLMLLPPEPTAVRTARISRETIIVIDTSGSMGGESISQARRAVDFALDTLRPEDAFNVIRFDSSVGRLFESARPATRDSVEAARRFVEQLQADGGTLMLPAIEAALTPGRESRAVRQVIFITDGAVGNESELFATIQQRLGQSRLFTVGIGSAPNSHFMSKAAQAGRGTFTYISRPEEVAAKMGALFRKLESPALHDLAIEWSKTGPAGLAADLAVEAWPQQIPDVYLGEPVVIAARLPEPTARVRLRGRRNGETIEIEFPLEGGAKHEGVARLWARRKIASLMDSLHEGAEVEQVSAKVASLGVEHQLVTRWSSLVAIDVTPTAPPGTMLDSRAVPGLLPRGWDFFKLFGGAGRDRSDERGPGDPDAPGTPQRSASGSNPPRVAPVAISQPMASVNIGRLPTGATPSALLMTIGSVFLGAAGICWRGTRRTGASESFNVKQRDHRRDRDQP